MQRFLIGLAALAGGCLLTPGRAAADPEGKTTVVWISMDGFRGDYLDRTALPFFARLQAEGVHSRRFRPSFPPITFPSHCAEATGVGAAQHGITGNAFYDSTARQTYDFPGDASLLRAEPIWLTAKRQGVRTLVFDWPLSQWQTDAVRDDYSADRYEHQSKDAQRLDRLLDVWRADYAEGKAGGPLRLLMGYVEAADPAGHRFGPDSPEVVAELKKLDAELAAFSTKATALWQEHAGPQDRLYLLLTTDHGMSPVAQDANLEKMLGVSHWQTEITLQTVGNMGHIFLDRIPAGPKRDAKETELLTKLRAYSFAHVFRRADLPPQWDYGHPTRTGDIVVVLPRGYTFNRRAPQAVLDAAQVYDGPKGMHGYPVEEDPDMHGVMFLQRWPQPFGGRDMGEVSWDQYHPTVAGLLRIKPADAAKGKPSTCRASSR